MAKRRAIAGEYVISNTTSGLSGIVKSEWKLERGMLFRVLNVNDDQRYLLEGDWVISNRQKDLYGDGNYWILCSHFDLAMKKIDFTDILNPSFEWVKADD